MPVEFWMGDSRGRWEGNTLVVDVTLFTGQTWFDRAGNFHSEDLHVVERYTRTGPDHILYEATIEDPKVFTRPWKMQMPLYRRQEPNGSSWNTSATPTRAKRPMQPPSDARRRVRPSSDRRASCAGARRPDTQPVSGRVIALPSLCDRQGDVRPPRTPDGQPDMQGFWRGPASGTENIEEHPMTDDDNGGKSLIVEPADGKVPYQPWAAALPKENRNTYVEPNVPVFRRACRARCMSRRRSRSSSPRTMS